MEFNALDINPTKTRKIYKTTMEFLVDNWVAVCISISLCLLSITWYFNPKQSSKNRARVHWPVVGALPSILWNSRRLPEYVTENFISHGGVGSLFYEGPVFSRLTYLVTCHPENIEYIVKSNFSNFPKGPDFKEIFDVLGDGIINADGEIWRSQRTMIHSIAKSFVFRSALAKKTQKLVETELVPFFAHVARHDSVINLQDICKRFMFDINILALFGKEEKYLTPDLPPNEFAEAMDTIHESVFLRHVVLVPMFCWKLFRLFNVGNERKLVQAKKIMNSTFKEYFSAIADKDGSNMLSMSIEWSQKAVMSNELLKDAILSLIFAGKDATASSLVWFFWMVAQTPRVEKKLVEELKSVVLTKQGADMKVKSNSPWVFDYDDVKDLVYLHAAMYEQLRLFSPIPFNSKSVVREDVLPDGTVVKPGMQIMISYFAEGKMPWIWGEDSLEFKPERWIDDEGKVRKERSKFFAFNVGPRSCLGKDMSIRMMKVLIASVLYNFHIELVDGQEVCSKPAISLEMKNGLRVKIQERIM